MCCLAPGAPLLLPEECSAENNSVTVAWQAPPGCGAGQRGPAIEGYLLELDDGCGGEFRVSSFYIFKNHMQRVFTTNLYIRIYSIIIGEIFTVSYMRESERYDHRL